MAGAISYPVSQPGWALTYKGKPITARIESQTVSVTYTSHAGGKAPELEFEIEDRDKLWQGPWFPTRGDLVALTIGYANQASVSCGNFQVDEVELEGPPDVMHLRCIAAYITPAMRTPNSTPYEGQTLLGIAGQVAKKYGFTVVGAAVSPDVTFARQTQNQETDLEFLHRLARDHNYEFTLRGQNLVFYSRPALELQGSIAIIYRSNETRFHLKTKTHQVYAAAQVSYQDPATKQLYTQTATGSSPTGDTLHLVRRCENGQQASLKAAAELHRHNMLQTTAEITMPGNTQMAAGARITVSGWGNYDSDYLIQTARHKLARGSGYTTEIELRSVS
jgi:uncharacterized protein